MRRRVEERHGMRAPQVEEDHVGELAGSSEPSRSAAPSACRRVERHHRERLRASSPRARRAGRPGAGSPRGAAPSRGRGRCPEIAPSVPSVTRTPAASMSGTRAKPLASLRFETGLCATVAPVRARIAISSSSSQTQCASTRARVEQPERIEVADDRPAVARLDVAAAPPGSPPRGSRRGRPAPRPQPWPPAGCPARRYRRRAAGSRRARPRRRRRRRRTPPPPRAAPRPPPRPSRGRRRRCRRSRPACPTSRAARDGLVGVPEHVHHGGDAAEQQLGEAERRAEPHGLAVEDRALGLPHGLQPRLQRQILDQPAEQAVAGVAMHVDEPRHQQHAARVDHLARVGADLRRRADPVDPPAADRDGAVAQPRCRRRRR